MYVTDGAESRWPVNYDLDNIITPVKVDVLSDLLNKTNMKKDDVLFLVNGFRHGFNLQYQGPVKCTCTSRNLPFVIGDKWKLWSKLEKEVRLGRVAGPYHRIPFDTYVQSPIGLVPKDGGDQT